MAVVCCSVCWTRVNYVNNYDMAVMALIVFYSIDVLLFLLILFQLFYFLNYELFYCIYMLLL